MGEMEHGRWNVERLLAGWKYAKVKNAEKKLSQYIVPWEKVEPRVRKYDFRNVRLWPETLADVGYEIYRLPAAKTKRRRGPKGAAGKKRR